MTEVAFSPLTSDQKTQRRIALAELGECSELSDVIENGWRRLAAYKYDDPYLSHTEIILSDTRGLAMGRRLPLWVFSVRDGDQRYHEWYHYPNHPLQEVRDETHKQANDLCAGIELLANRGLVEIVYLAPEV